MQENKTIKVEGLVQVPKGLPNTKIDAVIEKLYDVLEEEGFAAFFIYKNDDLEEMFKDE